MKPHEISFALGKIMGVTLLGHRHNCGKGDHPGDCSRLEEIGRMICDLAQRIDKDAEAAKHAD